MSPIELASKVLLDFEILQGSFDSDKKRLSFNKIEMEEMKSKERKFKVKYLLKVNKSYLAKLSLMVIIVSVRNLSAGAENNSSSVNKQSINTVSNSTEKISEMKPAAQKKFKLETTLEYAAAMSKDEVGERETDTTVALAPSYAFTNKLVGSALVFVNKEQYGAKNTTITDTSIALNYTGYQLNEYFGLLHGISGVLPTDAEKKKTDRYYGSAAIVNGISFSFSRLKGSYRLSFSKNFHEYKVNADGDPNISRSIRHRLSFGIELFSKLNFNFDGSVRNGYTYNEFERSSYESSIGLEIPWTDSFSIYSNIENKGSTYKANGVDSNIKFYDQLQSKITGGVTYVF